MDLDFDFDMFVQLGVSIDEYDPTKYPVKRVKNNQLPEEGMLGGQ